MNLGIGLNVKNSAEAVELYCKAFGLKLGYNVKNPDGSYYHSELYRGEKEILSVVESQKTELKDNIVQVGITLDSEDEVRSAFETLSNGAAVEMSPAPLPWSPLAAILTDRFGVWWYITAPQHYPDENFDPKDFPNK